MSKVCRDKKGRFVGKVKNPNAKSGGCCLSEKGKFTKPMCASCKGRALRKPHKK